MKYIEFIIYDLSNLKFTKTAQKCQNFDIEFWCDRAKPIVYKLWIELMLSRDSLVK